MNNNILTVAVVILILNSGCSVFDKVVYRPEINQGNYLTIADVAKISIGMTKQQVAYILGTSMIKDPLDANTWFYIFRRELNHKTIKQHTLTLIFNRSDMLIKIDNKPTFFSD